MSKSRKPSSALASAVTTPVAPLQITTAKADDLVLLPRVGRRTVYGPVIEKLVGLKKGEALIVTIPADTDYPTMSNRLTSAIANKKTLTAPTGCYFAKRQTKDGKLAIMVLAKIKASK